MSPSFKLALVRMSDQGTEGSSTDPLRIAWSCRNTDMAETCFTIQ